MLLNLDANCGSKISSLAYYYSEIIASLNYGPGSSSSKALGYGLDDPASIPGVGGWRFFFAPSFLTGPEVHSASYKMSTRGFPRGKGGRA